jgi:hypothetical protein
MLQPLQKVTIAGQERELLYTLSLYKILQDRKQQVVIDKEATWADVTSALLRMIYAAYLNAIEVRQIDEPKYKPEYAKYIDFVIWSEQKPVEFAEQIKICYKFITGKDIEIDFEKKKISLQQSNQQRTSIWRWIGKRFKTS